ncbi:phosphonoacetaldehyde hydrolase [Sphaerisporangium siamense]|uniref:Phosphonatase-like hydrolase n=1 Tax=Sphaerisporangium siamense TaxID=795645 RepID=A0A7W7G7V3_9ACTN|nr:phosphonatase-like hydrolase [Sphaerisporangium siamense]MBB4698934.1 phosphonatase-like hydrolase [Sphaerisporangium siamense]GII88541.1 phosphonoacetaldehyde hydrolase [Sphaerisporangium siamense]
MTIELMVLDIAGTTVEEYGAVYDALADAVTAAGGRPSTTDIQRWMGAGKREAVAHLLADHLGPVGDATVDAAFADFRARLDKAYRDRPPVALPGVPEALARVRAAGVKVALTTGFDREVTTGLLGTLGWDATVVDAVVCVDDVPAGRPAPYMIFRAMEATGVHDVSRVLVAGDTVRDLQAGTNAGAGFVVGVLTGKLDAVTLGAERHTHILPGVTGLPALL